MSTDINYWYDPINKIGNYWDNYTGTDTDDNERGDIPHDIHGDGNRQDLYPIYEDGPDQTDNGGTGDPDPDDGGGISFGNFYLALIIISIFALVSIKHRKLYQ